MQPWWLDQVCENWDVAVVKKGDEITGLWAYPVENNLGISMLRTPLLTPYLGPIVFYPGDLKDSRTDRFEHDTVAELMKQMPNAKVWHLALEPGMKQAGIFRKYKLRTEVQQTFLVALHQPEETILANIKETTRRNIRAAAKEITITTGNNCIKLLYDYQAKMLKGKGKPLAYSETDLKKILGSALHNNAGAIWVARKGETIEAIVCQVWDNNQSYYLIGGQNPEANGYKAMSLLLWHCIRESKKMGHAFFDLEGSMDEGVERFFRNFGGNRELYMVLLKNDSLIWKLKKTVIG